MFYNLPDIPYGKGGFDGSGGGGKKIDDTVGLGAQWAGGMKSN